MVSRVARTAAAGRGAMAAVGLALAIARGAGGHAQDARPTLVGWASLPAATFSPGPTSGQFAGAGQFGQALPVVDRQPVQGFSGVIEGPTPGTFYVITDNGFGTRANSADALLRVYAIRPSFRTAAGGNGTVSPAHFRSGAAMPSFTADSFVTLRDPDRRLSFRIVADGRTYPGSPADIAVPMALATNRWLTGADLDIESFRRTRDSRFWFGDEFGPFFVETDATGRVLGAEVSLPGVFAPENPHRGETPANLPSSGGFEGMALAPGGRTLFGLVEGTVVGDMPGTLHLHEFDIAARRFTGRSVAYTLESAGTAIGDMTAAGDGQFLVIERNSGAGSSTSPPPFKRIYLADTRRLTDTRVRKTLVADLMDLDDPDDLNRDGQKTFTFPFVTIEDVLVVDRRTLLIINDNNFPGGGGRGQFSDPTEVILVRLPTPLP